MLRRATLSYTELHEATKLKCYAVLRYASLCYAVLRSAALSYAVLLRRTTFRYAIKGLWLATPDPRSKTCASRAIAARRSAIKGVCLATPDPLSKTCASRAIAARRFAIKGVCLATPDPRSKTDGLAASL